MRRKAEETMGKVRRGTRAEMEEKGLRETVWSGEGEEGEASLARSEAMEIIFS